MATNDKTPDKVQPTTTPPPAMLVPVRSNRGNITIPYDNGKEKEGRLKGDLHLVAGPNLVPFEVWEACKRNPSVGSLLRAKIPNHAADEYRRANIGGKMVMEEGRPVPAAAPLSAYDDASACNLVADILDVQLLRQLEAIEPRAVVRRAIIARISAINEGSTKPPPDERATITV